MHVTKREVQHESDARFKCKHQASLTQFLFLTQQLLCIKTHLPLYYNTTVHPYADVVSVCDNTLGARMYDVHIVNRLRWAMKCDLPKQYWTDKLINNKQL